LEWEKKMFKRTIRMAKSLRTKKRATAALAMTPLAILAAMPNRTRGSVLFGFDSSVTSLQGTDPVNM
jgi:hypothetical protein